MSWLRIDDGFEDHPKVDALSDAAHRLWLRAACWCKKPSNEHTLGFVPRAQLRLIGKRSGTQAQLEKLAQELVDATAGGIFELGLWEPVEDGWRFHDWANYQPEADEERIKKKRSDAGRKGAAARWGAKSGANGKDDGTAHGKDDSKPMAPHRLPMAKNAPDPDPVPEVVSASGILPSEIQTRATKVLENPHDGEWEQPSKWPEVQLIATAWSMPFGIRELKLRNHPGTDSDLRAILAALADGYEPQALAELGPKAKASGFFAKMDRPGPACFTPAVLRRLFAEDREPDSYVVDAEGRLVQ